RNPAPLSQNASGCHCTPTTKRLWGRSTPSTTPSPSDRAHTDSPYTLSPPAPPGLGVEAFPRAFVLPQDPPKAGPWQDPHPVGFVPSLPLGIVVDRPLKLRRDVLDQCSSGGN